MPNRVDCDSTALYPLNNNCHALPLSLFAHFWSLHAQVSGRHGATKALVSVSAGHPVYLKTRRSSRFLSNFPSDSKYGPVHLLTLEP